MIEPTRQEILARLARLSELADYGLFETPGQQGSLWESDQPIIVRIHKTQNEVLQNAFASC